MLKDYTLERPEEVSVETCDAGRGSVVTPHWNICEDWIETGPDSEPVRFFESEVLTLTCDCTLTRAYIRESFSGLWANGRPNEF